MHDTSMPSHHKYGDARYTVFLVENMIFHVSNRLLKLSPFFRGMIEGIRTGLEYEGEDNDHPIFLSGISIFEMASFLDVTESRCLDGDPELTFTQWTTALHLATLWSFDDIREKIIEQVDGMISAEDPLDRIDASLKCRVEKWLHPAYVVLCKRDTGLSDAEAEKLGLRRSIAICRVRESLRQIQIQPPPAPQPQPPSGWPEYGSFGYQSMWPPRNAPAPPVQQPRSGGSNVRVSDAKALDLIKKEEALKFS